MTGKNRTYNIPFELAITAAQRRYRYGGYTPFPALFLQQLKPGLNSVEAAHRPPVILGGSINDKMIVSTIQVWFTQAHQSRITSQHVIFIHFGITFLKCQRYSLTHNSNGI